METKPLVTLITVCFNSERYLRYTLESVLNQSYPNIEYIVVDGNSPDKTLEILRDYEIKFKGRMKWVSEPDAGIYDAMNKGVQMSSGDIIGIINSDDLYAYQDVIQQIVDKFEHDNTDCVYADLEFVTPNDLNRVVRKWVAGTGSFRWGWNPPHPTTFIKKDVYDKFGLYKVSYKISSDYDLLYRIIYKGNVNTSYLNRAIVKMRVGGASTSGLKSNFIASKEIYQTLQEHDEKYKFFLVFLRLVRKIAQYTLKG